MLAVAQMDTGGYEDGDTMLDKSIALQQGQADRVAFRFGPKIERAGQEAGPFSAPKGQLKQRPIFGRQMRLVQCHASCGSLLRVATTWLSESVCLI